MTKEEAIDVLKKNYPDSCYELLREAVDMAIKALKQPEQKIGKWKMDKEGNWYCSECGLHYDSWAKGLKYCPNCGAKMEEK